MKKYKVVVPPPSAKRMAGNGKVIIHFDESFGSGSHSIQRQFNQDVECLELGLVEVEFDVPDSYEWLGATSSMDGCVFTVEVEYRNSTGSRKESKNLKPIEVIMT